METSSNTQKTINDIHSVHIHGREWFRKSAGNSYQTVRLEIQFKDGTRETYSSARHSGYGQYYQQLALILFLAHFPCDYPKDKYGSCIYPYLSSLLREKQIPFFDTKHKVLKKKDL